MIAFSAHRISATLVLALTLAACQREASPAADTIEPQPAAPAAAPATPAQATVPGTDALEAVDNGPLDPQAQTVGGLHTREFVGTFSTKGARIEFNADGTYGMTVHAASADADLESSGTWTVQAGGAELLLDSNDKSEPDRRYAVVSKDEIRQIEGGQTLRREIAQ